MFITMDNNITEATYSPNSVENVIAISRIQQSGHKILFPASINDWIANGKGNKLGWKECTFAVLHDLFSSFVCVLPNNDWRILVASISSTWKGTLPVCH